MVEIVFTACSCSSCSRRQVRVGFGGLSPASRSALIHLVTIPIDNTSVNPARSLGAAIFADTVANALSQLWAFIVFPLIGSVVGVFVWLLVDDARWRHTLLDTDLPRTTRDAADDVGLTRP